MEATETITNGKPSRTKSQFTEEVKPKRARRTRPAPLAFSAQQLKPASFPMPNVATQGISFESITDSYTPFSLTDGGADICIKKSKSEAVQIYPNRKLFDGKNLTVYPLVW